MSGLKQTISRAARTSFFAALLACASSAAFGAGPLVNDVGQGAMVWGTSSEQTTYLGPYYSAMAPKIRRIPEENLVVHPDYADRGNLWKTTNEVGTVFGTDGNVYNYHYEYGYEPQVVRETRVVDGKEQIVERVVRKPLIIRVLEPLNKTDPQKNQAQGQPGDGKVAPCAPNANLPKPCAPAGAGDAQNPSDPANNRPSLENNNDGQIHDPTVGNNTLGLGPNDKVDCVVSITIPDASRAPAVVQRR